MIDLHRVDSVLGDFYVEVGASGVYLRIEPFVDCFPVVVEVAVVYLVEIFAEVVESDVEDAIVSAGGRSSYELQLFILHNTIPKLLIVVSTSPFPPLFLILSPWVPQFHHPFFALRAKLPDRHISYAQICHCDLYKLTVTTVYVCSGIRPEYFDRVSFVVAQKGSE